MEQSEEVPSSSYVLRRISPDWIVDDGQGGERVSSAAFQDKGRGMSVALSVTLDELGLPYAAAVESFEGYGLLQYEVAWIRSMKLEVERSPTEAEPWHGDVTGTKTGSVRKAFSANATHWVRKPTSRPSVGRPEEP